MASFDFMYLIPKDEYTAMQHKAANTNVEVNNVINPGRCADKNTNQQLTPRGNVLSSPISKKEAIRRGRKKPPVSAFPPISNGVRSVSSLPSSYIQETTMKQKNHPEEEAMEVDEIISTPPSQEVENNYSDVEMDDLSEKNKLGKNKKKEKETPVPVKIRQKMKEIQDVAMKEIVKDRLETLQGKKKKKSTTSKIDKIKEKERSKKYKTLHSRLLHEALHPPSLPVKRKRGEERENGVIEVVSKKRRMKPPRPGNSQVVKRRLPEDFRADNDSSRETKRLNLRPSQRVVGKREAADISDSPDVDPFAYSPRGKKQNTAYASVNRVGTFARVKRNAPDTTYSEDEEDTLIPRKVRGVRSDEVAPEDVPLPQDYFNNDESSDSE